MSTIRFTLRTDQVIKKGYQSGLAPLEIVIQVTGQRKYYRTEIKLHPLNWNADEQLAVFVDKDTARLQSANLKQLSSQKEINEINKETLPGYRARIADIEKRLQVNQTPYSSLTIVDKLKEDIRGIQKVEENKNVVFEFMEQYINDQHSLREAGSLTVYKSVMNHLKNFCNETGRKVTFQNIDYKFFEDFQIYLLKDKTDKKTKKVIPGLNNTTVAKQLSTVKTFLNYARKRGIEVSNKYKDFKITREDCDIIALTNEEFEKLFYLDLSGNTRLEKVRDIFCFACVTGLRYSDMNQLKREHINIKEEEIRLTIKKTKSRLMVPLNDYALAILARYEDCLKPLPMISNAKLNASLKGFEKPDANGNKVYHPGLCEIAGIDDLIEVVTFRGGNRINTTMPKYKKIGVHTGRKTFATLSLERGGSAEVIMASGGWKDYKSFKRYIHITEQRKKTVMKKLWGGLKENNLKAVS